MAGKTLASESRRSRNQPEIKRTASEAAGLAADSLQEECLMEVKIPIQMPAEGKSILRWLLRTESEWNPKVIIQRAVLPLIPESALIRLKKSYYAYLIAHTPETWMERDAAVTCKLISPGDTVLDIGANIGIYSRMLARCVGSQGTVYAFEPIPHTFDFLSNNMRRLGLKNVDCLDFAASDADRTDTMVIPTYRWGSECWYDARIKTANANPSWRTITVKSRTLDSLFFDGPRCSDNISFIKCDANFHELAVLKGGLRTIRKSKPAMLIEVNPDPDDPATTAFATFELLRNAGYEVFCFNGKSIVPRDRGERSQNYFFLTPHHLQMMESV